MLPPPTRHRQPVGEMSSSCTDSNVEGGRSPLARLQPNCWPACKLPAQQTRGAIPGAQDAIAADRAASQLRGTAHQCGEGVQAVHVRLLGLDQLHEDAQSGAWQRQVRLVAQEALRFG